MVICEQIESYKPKPLGLRVQGSGGRRQRSGAGCQGSGVRDQGQGIWIRGPQLNLKRTGFTPMEYKFQMHSIGHSRINAAPFLRKI